MIAIGNARGGKPMANEIFEAPAGFLVGTGEGAQVLLGGLAVQFKLQAGQTAGRLSIREMMLHPHRQGAAARPVLTRTSTRNVAAGTIGVRVRDGLFEAAQGCYLVKPRGVAHVFWNPTDDLVKTVETIVPAGSEVFFEEPAAASATGDTRQTQQ
jgi:hypothetical protein